MSETTELKVMEANTEMQVFGNMKDFEAAQRMAVALANSTIIPVAYQKNPSNCLIAVEMAMRMKLPPMMIMQNLHVIKGRPSWGSGIIIGLINNSRRYKAPLAFNVTGKGDSLSCYCWAIDQEGEKIEGPTITMEMAKKEGWTTKDGSKWATMPEVMIRYRAASFFGRIYCPDILMGLYTTEEVIEMDEPAIVPVYATVAEEIDQNANQETLDIQPEQQETPAPQPEEQTTIAEIEGDPF